MSTPAPTRLPLSTGGELRAGLWFARLLTLASLYPLGYAFFGWHRFDWDAMIFGGPGVLIGLALWWWTGWSLRHPDSYLEIDRQAGVARLVREGELEASAPLVALGSWSLRSWKVRTTHKGQVSITTWHAARCPGFGKRDTFKDIDAGVCKAWIAKAEAAAGGRPLPEGDRRPLGEGIGLRFDAVVSRLSGLPAALVLSAATVGCAVLSWPWLEATRNPEVQAPLFFAVVAGLIAIGWRVWGQPWLAALTAALAGFGFAAKPWYAPLGAEFEGELLTLSPTSESHLYYLGPGLALVGLALIMIRVALRARARPAEASKQQAPAKPKPPKPPKPS